MADQEVVVMGDKAPNEVRERVWVEKFDHNAEEPTLVETVFVEQTKTVGPDGRIEIVTTRMDPAHPAEEPPQ
jgi:hypothetical protein